MRIPRIRPLALVALVGLVPLAACGDSEPASPDEAWTAVTVEEMDAGATSQLAQAIATRDALFGALAKRVGEAVVAGGPVEAIRACREEAHVITTGVAAEQGVRAGRTSFRLRNPENVPPPWAAALVEAKTEDRTFLTHADGRLAALLPIRLQHACVTCHGQPDAMPAPLRDALATAYPDDRATGFAAGDLRGYFWLEIPAVR